MKSGMLLTTIFLIATSAGATEPTSGQPPPTTEGVIEPKADAALKKMSDYLSNLKSLQVQTTTVDEKFTADGHKIQQVQDSTVTVARPNDLRVDRTGANGHTIWRYDGKRFSAVNKDKNVYATAPAPPKLDAAIDEARERLKVDLPGGDLLVSDPYAALTDGMIEGRYIGLEPIDGAMAHHLAVTKKNMMWQIWIKDGPDAMPLRYVVTSEDLPGRPEFTLQLRNWQPNAPVQADNFSFSPPPGAKQVAFAPPQSQPPPQPKAERKGE
jgi:hypothetical protein